MDSALPKAWLVIEALPEKLSLKIDIFGQLAEQAAEDCILASNSSSFKSRFMLDKVDAGKRHRVCNMHYFMPPGNNTVELMTCGYTHGDILPFLYGKIAECGMQPAIARKESTGFIFNRLWAAIKREVMLIMAEGVSDPAEIDKLFLNMFKDSELGPCGIMDSVGLDTVAFIEGNYIQERGIDSTARDWLVKNYVEKGKLGTKSGGKGGLYPAAEPTTTTKSKEPTLYFLDVGLGSNVPSSTKLATAGKLMTASANGTNIRELLGSQAMPDGIDICPTTQRLFWTNMGSQPSTNSGSIHSISLDGTSPQAVLPIGEIHTPKQLTIDHVHKKLYICDREGMRIHRCDFSGANHEILYQAGDHRTSDVDDQTRWCVGIAVDDSSGKIYWSQKGGSKSSQGRIFRANMDLLAGESASTRTDIEVLFSKLPEPIDLEFESDTQMLWWTDRGEYPEGNTLNKAFVGGDKAQDMQVQIVARHFHEAIGLKLDSVNRHVYVTDLGGAVYRVDMDGSGKKEKIVETDSAYTGIALAYMG
jgi:3-hydroxyacyl-CoA dehydrogenase